MVFDTNGLPAPRPRFRGLDVRCRIGNAELALTWVLPAASVVRSSGYFIYPSMFPIRSRSQHDGKVSPTYGQTG